VFSAQLWGAGALPVTLASWLFATASSSPSAVVAGALSVPTLALVAVAALCAMVVEREYRGTQWA